MPVRITKDDVPLLLKAVEELTKNEVLVGIPGTADPRKWTGIGINNAYLGYIHEFGTMNGRIPARPWLRPGIQSGLPDIERACLLGARDCLKFPIDPDAGNKALIRIGLVAQRSVRRYLNAGVAPPLAASTIAARRSRKIAPRQGTVPLIDTGQLRNAVNYVIRPKR